MKIFFPFSIIIAACLAACFSSCNSDDDDEDWEMLTYSNVSVKTFKLGKNDSILEHLDTVFFSIDLDAARIFNADSLPMGTRTNGLTVSIGLPEVSRAMIYFDGKDGRDSLDYMTQSTDTIDFSRGPAILSLTSIDGLATRDYTINVNVHKSNPDSLVWGRTAIRRLPTDLQAMISNRTVELDGTYYCLTASNSEANIATTDNLQADWDIYPVALPQGAVINTFSAGNHTLYIIGASSTLYASTDGGHSWAATTARMSHIYGAYGSELLGTIRRADGSYVAISYPSQTDPETAPTLPDGCPVSGTSNLMVYTTEWSAQPMAITTGGLDARGSLTGASWAYDGNQWACISIVAGTPRQGMAVVPYFAYRTDEYWVVRDYSVLIAFGGANSRGQNDNSLWMSFDRGVHWSPGPASLQLPDFLPALRFSSAFVESQTLTAGSRSASSLWAEYPVPAIPARAMVNYEWECPYIYVVGGYTTDSRTANTIWRGAINRLTFRPLF